MVNFLSSIKLAVALLAALVLASVIATLYPQMNVFSSLWFRGLLILFCFNLFLCTFKSLPNVFKRIRQVPRELREANNIISFKIQEPVKYKAGLKEYLKSKGFKVQEATQDGHTNILAQAGVLSLLAPHLLHLALIIVLLGGFLSSFGTEGRVTCFVGEKALVPTEIADMEIEVNEFETLYDNEGAIENWVTDFNVYIAGKKAAAGITKVNDPFKYQGVVFYQKSYGYNHLIEVKGEEGGTFRVPDGKVFKLEDQFFNLNYTQEGTVLKFFNGHEVTKTLVVEDNSRIDFSDKTSLVYLRLQPFTVLGLKKDPGTKVVMTGFFLMTIASAFFWTGRYREVLITIKEKEKMLYIYIFSKSKGYKEELLNDLEKEVGAD